MKVDLNYLPQHKQDELSTVVSIIHEVAAVEMIILFGSYACNNWVEEKYDEQHYRYQSDFDILVIVETKSDSAQGKIEDGIEKRIRQNEAIKTPTSILVHDLDFVNRRLSKAQYFFSDIKKEGVLLYDSNKHKLKEAKELTPKERSRLAQEDFEYWFKSANDFYKGYKGAVEDNALAFGAFLLHQVTERLYSAILLVFTHYKPNTHDLEVLRKLVNSLDNRLLRIFPLDTAENRRLFTLLRKAYVEARYKPNYAITHEEILKLADQVEELRELGKLICAEKISSFEK